MSQTTESLAEEFRQAIAEECRDDALAHKLAYLAAEHVLRALAARDAMEAAGEKPLEMLQVPMCSDLFSISRACHLLDCTPPELREAMEQSGARFTLRLDDKPFIDGANLIKTKHWRDENK